MPEPLMDYLGDGVYAIDRGDGIILHANDPLYPTDRIFLEPSVLDALSQFSTRCVAQAKRPEPPALIVTEINSPVDSDMPIEPPPFDQVDHG